jgi:hypothetical protein
VVAAAGVLVSAIATHLALSRLRANCSYSTSLLSPPVVLRTQGLQHDAFSCVAGCTTGSPQNRYPSHISRFTASTLMRRPSARRPHNTRQYKRRGLRMGLRSEIIDLGATKSVNTPDVKRERMTLHLSRVQGAMDGT